MISDAQYLTWLRQTNVSRVLLAELQHSAGTQYVASRPFVSGPADSPAHTPYNDILSGAFDITRRLDSSLAIGDIQLTDDGRITHWSNLLWQGFPVILKLGSPDWALADFRVIANQINSGIQSARRGQLVLGVQDVTAALNTPIERPDIEGQAVPLLFGQVFGAGAIPINGEHLYRVSWLPVTSLTVRDGNGPVLSHTPDYGNGQFTTSAYTPRSISCEVYEPHDTAAKIIQWVADHYDLPLVPVSLPDYTMGLRYTNQVTGRQILDDVCRSIGAHWSINLQGELQIQRLELPITADVFLVSDDILRDKIALIRTELPVKSVSINYDQNHSALSEVAGSINDSDPTLASRLRNEWLRATQSQNLPDYPDADAITVDTVLVDQPDAVAESNRRLALRSQRRDVWEITAFMAWSDEIVGQAIHIDHPLLAGKIGRVISSRMAPTKALATLEVWY